MLSILQDVRFGLRLTRKAPGFTMIAVLVLTVGIGGTAAMFNVINALVLKPLPVREPERLVRLYQKHDQPSGMYRSFSYSDYTQYRQKADRLTDLLAFAMIMAGSNEGEMTRRTFAAMISANYFDVLGVKLFAGRLFSPAEDRPGSAIPVVIVSHNYWKNRGADPGLIGKTIRINARPFQVIGIAPKYFTGTTALFSPEFWLPLGAYELLVNDFINEKKQSLSERNHHGLMLVGRLKPGATMSSAEAQLKGIASQLAQAYPDTNKDHTVQLGALTRLSMNTVPQHDSGMALMSSLVLGVSGAVLLIACLNIANMLLARGAARRREVAIRLAMGSRRGRVMRQLLTEAFVLALLGGAGGVWFASWGSQLMFASLGSKLSFVNLVFDPHPDWRMLLAILGICAVSVLMFALGPAWRLSKVNVTNELKEVVGDELHSRSGLGILSLKNSLVVGQLALSLALLTATGLFMRSAIAAAKVNPGFSFDEQILVETDAALGGYDESRGKQIYAEALGRLRALPGVASASLAHVTPFGIYSDARDVRRISSDPQISTNSAPSASAGFNIVAKDYFKTLGIPLLRGRDFDRLETSTAAATKVAIIDEPLAKILFKEEDPVGKHVTIRDTENLLVIGVVGGVRDELDNKENRPHIYIPFGQQYRSGMNIHVRTAGVDTRAAKALIRSIRDSLHSVDPQFPILSLQTFRQFHEEGLRMWFVKTAARLFGIFGLLALFLAVVGIYGVKSYVVARRTREIGVRIALGATRNNVLWMVLKDGLRLTCAGVCVGLLLSLALGFILRSFLFGLSAIDPVAFTVPPLCLVVAALIACYLPAQRATHVEPIAALRCE